MLTATCLVEVQLKQSIVISCEVFLNPENGAGISVPAKQRNLVIKNKESLRKNAEMRMLYGHTMAAFDANDFKKEKGQAGDQSQGRE